MKLSARAPAGLYPQVRGRQRRSISLTPYSTTAPRGNEDIFFAKSLHRRSHSVKAGTFGDNENLIDEEFRIMFGSSVDLMDLTSDRAPAEQRRLPLVAGNYKENAVSTEDDVAFKLSCWAVINRDVAFQDCSPRTPISHLSNRMQSWSPPPHRKPSYVYFEVSPKIASDLLLPDCF